MRVEMAKKTKARRTNQKQRPLPIGLIVGIIIAVGLVSLIGYAIWASIQPQPELGHAYPIASRDHIQFGQQAVDRGINKLSVELIGLNAYGLGTFNIGIHAGDA